MIITWTLVLALAYQPYPTIALLKEFKTRETCEARILTIDVSTDERPRLACVPIAHEEI